MIEIKVDDREIKELLKRILKKSNDMSPAMKDIADIMLDAVEKNFEEEGRPSWPPLSPSTIKERQRKGFWPGKILQREGTLAGSISEDHGPLYALVGTNIKYAPIHQFGGRSGKGHRARIPARPFLSLTEEDKDGIVEVLREFLDSL
ncbi:hypothetical protein HRbin37_02114 [bacterium HR37]|nr:hypothetical protein HRbin37_02114 [bacterium HR37]